MRRFRLVRTEDVSGVSGTGVVAWGAVMEDGQAVLWWPNEGSIGIYRDAQSLMRIHGHGGRTTLEFLD